MCKTTITKYNTYNKAVKLALFSIKTALLLCLFCSFGAAVKQLPEQYTVRYGDKRAPITIVEYFSFGCGPCIRGIAEDFDYFRNKYVTSGKVRWVFHPHPVDLITVQGMVCLEALSEHQKQLFLEASILERQDSPDMMLIFNAALSILKIKIIELQDTKAVQGTSAFKAAASYLLQSFTFSGTPTIEINGEIYDEFPTRAFIEEKIEHHLRKGEQ